MFSVEMAAQQQTSAPTTEELRFCKQCNRDLPLKMFLKGPRRFICRKHMRAMVKLATLPLTADEKAARKIWVSSYKDVKSLCGDTNTIKLTHVDIKTILESAGQPPTSYRNVFILPRVPTEPLTASNTVLCGHSARRYLITLWRKQHDIEAYAKAVRTLGAEPFCEPLSSPTKKEMNLLQL